MKYDVIIIGGGAAGLACALYSARFNLKTLVIAKDFGGTGNIAHLVDNWIGEPGVTGLDLMEKFIDHVKKYKVPLVEEWVKNVKKKSKEFVVETEKKKYQSKTVVFANGMEERKLNVPGEKEFQGKGVHYCYTCLTPDTNVMTNPDIKTIKDVKDDKILTHKGDFKNFFKKVNTHYEGNILSITPRLFGGKTKLTPNHRVLGIKRTWKNYKSVEERRKLKPEWIEAKELRKGDYVTYPIVKKDEDIKYLILNKILRGKKLSNDYILELNKSPTSKKIPNKIKLDGDLLRLFGYYISEGCLNHNGIQFTFNKNEINYIKDTKNLIEDKFRIQSKNTTSGNVTKVYLYSNIVRDLFEKYFGKYAHEKKIPQKFIYLPIEKQKELVKGMWRGDGCLTNKSFTYVTSSKKLAHQLKLILMRFDLIPRVDKREKDKLKPGNIDGRIINFNHDKYHVGITGPYLEKGEGILDVKHPKTKERNRVMHYGWMDEDYAYLPIRDIRNEFYSGKVYDLTVEGENSYTTENMVVHNCDMPLYGGKVVGVVGGGDAAGLGTLFGTEYAKKVYVIYRGNKLRAEPITTEQVYKNKKVEVIHKANVKEIYGDKFMKGVKLDTGRDLKLDGLFIQIGHLPLTDMAKKLGVKLDERGFINVDKDQNTNVAGVFAAGDITNATGLKQFITSASEGSIASQSAYFYLQRNR